MVPPPTVEQALRFLFSVRKVRAQAEWPPTDEDADGAQPASGAAAVRREP